MKEVVTTEADKIFYAALQEGDDLWKAAYKAFPMMEDPIEYAQELVSEGFMAARFNNLLSEKGMSDKNLAEFFVKAFTNAEENPSASKAQISALKEIAHLKRLYSSDNPSNQKQAEIANDAPLTQAGMLKQFMKQALDEMPEEDLIEKVRAPIIKQPDLDDGKVFDV